MVHQYPGRCRAPKHKRLSHRRSTVHQCSQSLGYCSGSATKGVRTVTVELSQRQIRVNAIPKRGSGGVRRARTSSSVTVPRGHASYCSKLAYLVFTLARAPRLAVPRKVKTLFHGVCSMQWRRPCHSGPATQRRAPGQMSPGRAFPLTSLHLSQHHRQDRGTEDYMCALSRRGGAMVGIQ